MKNGVLHVVLKLHCTPPKILCLGCLYRSSGRAYALDTLPFVVCLRIKADTKNVISGFLNTQKLTVSVSPHTICFYALF